MIVLITGITGMDGSILADQLLAAGAEVHGLIRRQATPNMTNLRQILPRIHLHSGDLTDQTSIDEAVRESQPDMVFNLAAQSHVGTSFRQPALTGEVTGLGAVRVFEAVRRFHDTARVYQAGSSEMFGNAPVEPQNESTPMAPVSPYGIAKLYAFHAARTYRRSYGMFITNGILYNHEGERRGEDFVTRKISLWAASLALGYPYRLQLGNIHVQRDWGYAPEYTQLMVRALSHTIPDDFIGATGETHSVLEFLTAAIMVAGGNPKQVPSTWVTWNNPDVLRPSELFTLRGDATKARSQLGWEPHVRFADLVRIMVRADIEAERNRRSTGTPLSPPLLRKPA